MEYPLVALCKVDEGRVGENCDCYEHQQQTKLLQVGQYQKLETLGVKLSTALFSIVLGMVFLQNTNWYNLPDTFTQGTMTDLLS